MRSSPDNNKEKRTVRKGGKVKASPRNQAGKGPGRKDEPISPAMGLVMTEDEFRTHVSRKAYELYEKRRALTDVEDWLEAERLVKQQLLAKGQWAGSV